MDKIELSDFKNYLGDVNLEHGGLFVNLDDWKYGYADCLRITDLDSGAGFNGAVLVERIIAITDNPQEITSALTCCGWKDSNQKLPTQSGRIRRLIIVDSIVQYGYYELLQDFNGPNTWIIQTDSDLDYASMEFDGWKAELRLPDNQTIFEYLLDNGFLREFE